MLRLLRLPAFTLALLALGCTDPADPAVDAGSTPGVDAGPPEDPFRDDCEALNPEFCGLPFPSDYWLADDATTVTGHRVRLGPTTLPRAQVRRRQPIDPEPFNTRDGWSVNAGPLAYLPGATEAGLATPADIDRSLADDSPTVLIDAATGERVAHFVDLDQAVLDADTPRVLILRPVRPLAHSTRYIAALRGIVGATTPETFAALRDGTPSDVPSIEARRAHFEDVFTTLEGAGVARSELQLAWDFTTASLEDDTSWMIAARDRALAAVGDTGPEFRITSIEELPDDPDLVRRVNGMMTVPLFLDVPDAGAHIHLDADGLPTQNGTAEYAFVVNIPRSVTPDTPGTPMQYGHGLLGDRLQTNNRAISAWANENGFIPFAVDWVGMAFDDVPTITIAFANGTLQDFRSVPERLVQGLVNAQLAMRMMLRTFGDHPDVMVDGRSIVDTRYGVYTGDSQGGIFGATYMALTVDVERGILGVPGQPYHLLLNRSEDFDPYLSLLRQGFEDGPNIQLVQALVQQLWDRAEPGSFSAHIERDLFPGTPAHRVLLQVGIGDHQVSTLGAHVMARAIGASGIEPMVRPIWGIDPVTGPHLGSAIVEWDYGNPPEPLGNVPAREGRDPHGDVRKQPAASMQGLHFLRTGEVIQTCVDACVVE